MPAKSKKQQRFMGMVHAAQKGEKPASPEVAKVAKSISKKAAEEFASTKHEGLPERVTNEGKGDDCAYATLYYLPADQPPTPEQVRQAVRLLQNAGFPVNDAMVMSPQEHPGEPYSTWLVDPAYGAAHLELDGFAPEETHLKGAGIEVYVENPPGLFEEDIINDLYGLLSEHLTDEQFQTLLEQDPGEMASLGYPSLEREPEQETTVDEPAVPAPRKEVSEIIQLIMTSLEPEEIQRVARMLALLSKHPKMWQGPKRTRMESYIDDIAGMVTDDPDVVGEEYGRQIPKRGEPHDPSVRGEDATGSGGVAAGGGAMLEDMPMTEEGPEGKCNCKLCGCECGPDKACDTKGCPNNREDETPMESKSMKKMRLIKESATGRLSRRTHRLLDVASGGQILTEDQWKDKVGEENLSIAKEMGLLAETVEEVLGEEEMPEGEPMAEQPPFPGAEAPEPEGDEMPDMGGEEEEMEEEEMPITKDELAKFLEALKDRADDEALEMITNAIGVEEEVGDEEGLGDEVPDMGDEGGPPLGEQDEPGDEEAEEDAAEEDAEAEVQAEADKKWGQKALKDADKPPSEGGTKGSLRKMMGKKEGEKITRSELKSIIDSPTASKEKKQKALAIYNLGGGAKSESVQNEDVQISEIAETITEDL